MSYMAAQIPYVVCDEIDSDEFHRSSMMSARGSPRLGRATGSRVFQFFAPCDPAIIGQRKNFPWNGGYRHTGRQLYDYRAFVRVGHRDWGARSLI